jgi:serine/threonine protein phosphatase PrpC
MGRNQGGAVSSSLAVETVLDVFDRDNPFLNPNYFFQKAFRQANNRILDQLSDSYGGASVAIALFDRKTLYYALAGNVQIAVFRGHDLVQITEGHTVNVLAEKKYTVGSLTKQETISLLRERRLYNYVGRDEFCDVEIFDAPVHLRQGDIVVLMTDGVYESVPHTDIEKILSSVRGCQEKANAIIKAVDEFDGVKDNASVVLIAI